MVAQRAPHKKQRVQNLRLCNVVKPSVFWEKYAVSTALVDVPEKMDQIVGKVEPDVVEQKISCTRTWVETSVAERLPTARCSVIAASVRPIAEAAYCRSLEVCRRYLQGRDVKGSMCRFLHLYRFKLLPWHWIPLWLGLRTNHGLRFLRA